MLFKSCKKFENLSLFYGLRTCHSPFAYLHLDMSDPEEKELFMLDTFQQLPKPNKLTALYLFEHLRRYDAFASVKSSLSPIIIPSCLRLYFLKHFIII